MGGEEGGGREKSLERRLCLPREPNFLLDFCLVGVEVSLLLVSSSLFIVFWIVSN